MATIAKTRPAPKRSLAGWVTGKLAGLTFYWFVLPVGSICLLCYGGWWFTNNFIEPTRWLVTDYAAEKMANAAGKTLTQGDGLPSVSATPDFDVDWNNPCYLAALLLAEKHRVPANVVVNIIHTESRGKPDAVGQNTNGTADHGCMQLNDQYHLGRFKKKTDMYVAARNVEAGIQFLKELYKEQRDWDEVATMYHSRTASKRQRYKRSLVSSSNATGAPLDTSALSNLVGDVY